MTKLEKRLVAALTDSGVLLLEAIRDAEQRGDQDFVARLRAQHSDNAAIIEEAKRSNNTDGGA